MSLGVRNVPILQSSYYTLSILSYSHCLLLTGARDTLAAD